MPEKLEVFRCQFCGMEYAREGDAENCEKTHLHIPDMELGHIEKPANDDFCYMPQTWWPTFIYLKCTSRSLQGAYYQLVVPGSRKMQAPREAP